MKTAKNGNETDIRQEKEELKALISTLSTEDKFRLLLKLRALKAAEV